MKWFDELLLTRKQLVGYHAKIQAWWNDLAV